MLQPRYPAATPIARGFIALPHGDLHYRTAGQGPVILALHESPRSSLSLLPVIAALADRYQVIAPDTPGYGLSDPLPGATPTMDDFLDALVGLIDGFGLERVAIYGAHTGAALATAFAQREPNRVSALVLDGLSAFDAGEIEAFRTRYLAPYAPSWDGSHVMGLWSRAKDLFTWFPWYDRTPQQRLRHEPGDVTALHKSALGFLQAGAHYAKAYTLAAAFQPNDVLGSLRAPVTVMARPDDIIADHLSRLTPGPGWEIAWLGPDAAEWSATLHRGFGKAALPGAAASPPRPATQGSRFLAVGEGWIHALQAGPEQGPVRLLLPGLPGDIKTLVAEQAALRPSERLVALSLPGCGWSDPLAGSAGLDAVLDVLDAAFDQLGLQPVSLAGEGASGVVADLWVRRRGWPLTAETIDPPTWIAPDSHLPDAPLLASLPPRWDGTHLTGAWFQLRDLQLYDIPPGAGRPSRRRNSDTPDVARLDRLFRSYVEGPDCAEALAAVVDYLRRDRPDAPPQED